MKSISFLGCMPEYTRNGIYVKPIACNPSEEEIEKVVGTTKTEYVISRNKNSLVYPYGKKYVIKKFASKLNSKKELTILDKIYDEKLQIPNMEQGLYGFNTQDGYSYIVASKIVGANPDIKFNKFNKENLSYLINIFKDLDTPIYSDDLDELDNKFPYVISINYELDNENIKITNDVAGIVNTTCFEKEKLQDKLLNKEKNDCNCNFSDIPGIVSNLRVFEYKVFLPYLLKLDKKESDKIFKDYLIEKADYHLKMSNHFISEKHKISDSDSQMSKINENLSNQEFAHYIMLRKPDNDTIKAEKIKIQIARFIFNQGSFANDSNLKINKKQIVDFVNNAGAFFYKKRSESDSKYETRYWQDCIDLIKNWSGVIPSMNWQDREPCFDMFNFSNKPVDEITDSEFHTIQQLYKEHKSIYELFTSKKTDEKQPCFVEI